MKNKKNKKVGIYIIIALVLATGLAVYLLKGQPEAKDNFPELTLAPGSTFKGMFTDPAKFYQYEEGDTCSYPEGTEPITLKQGQHIYYATEDLSFQDVLDRINCVPFNRIRILYYEPENSTFYSFPVAYYSGTETVSDPSSVTIKAFHGFIIESSKETLIGGVHGEDEPITSGMTPENSTPPYEFFDSIGSGWVLVPSLENYSEFKSVIEGLSDRIEKIFEQKVGNYSFSEVQKESNGEYNTNFNEGVYFVWIKLEAAPQQSQFQYKPAVTEEIQNIGNLGGQIMQGASNENFCTSSEEGNNQFCVKTTGDAICEDKNLVCDHVEVKDTSGQEDYISIPSIQQNGGGCGYDIPYMYDNLNGDNLSIRATCKVSPGECGGADSTHVCVTGAQDTSTSNGKMFKNLFFTGQAACESVNKTCTGIEIRVHENGTWSPLITSSEDEHYHTICFDRLPDLANDGTIQGYIINGEAYYPIRAECAGGNTPTATSKIQIQTVHIDDNN